MRTPLASTARPTRRHRGRRSVAALGMAAGLIAGTSLSSCKSSDFAVAYHDTFDGSELSDHWFTYRGSPSTDPNGTWTADRVRLQDGAVVLDAVPTPGQEGHWDIGGMANHLDPQVYGRWTIRFRVTTSDVVSWHLLLWSQDESWPPEIDIAEGWDRERAKTEGFLHYLDEDGNYAREYNGTTGDFTQWNTVVLTWTPGRITWSLNGQQWAEVTGAAVPSSPMRLSMQIETQSCNRTGHLCTEDTATPVPGMQVDDVLVESYIGPPAAAATTTTTATTSTTEDPAATTTTTAGPGEPTTTEPDPTTTAPAAP